jgi:hypothetical protein
MKDDRLIRQIFDSFIQINPIKPGSGKVCILHGDVILVRPGNVGPLPSLLKHKLRVARVDSVQVNVEMLQIPCSVCGSIFYMVPCAGPEALVAATYGPLCSDLSIFLSGKVGSS